MFTKELKDKINKLDKRNFEAYKDEEPEDALKNLKDSLDLSLKFLDELKID